MVSRSEIFQRTPTHAANGSAVLSRIGWLSRMPADFQEAVLSVAVWRVAPPATEFIHAGDEQGGMFAIASGIAEVALESGHPDTRVIHLCHAGFWGGYGPLLGHRRVVAVGARGEVLWALIPQRALERLLAEQPRWWKCLAHLADETMQLASGALADLTRQDSLHRAVAVLLRLAGCRYEDPPHGEIAEVRISQVDLAAMAVMSRNTLSGIFSELVRRGLIDVQYRSILLKDSRSLRALLAED
jgi:CRP/FNR family transcriptional regulator, cyclic AMP receptor protein